MYKIRWNIVQLCETILLHIYFWILTKSIFIKISKNLPTQSAIAPALCFPSLSNLLCNSSIRSVRESESSSLSSFLGAQHLEDACKCCGFPTNAPRSSMEWSRWGVQSGYSTKSLNQATSEKTKTTKNLWGEIPVRIFQIAVDRSQFLR